MHQVSKVNVEDLVRQLADVNIVGRPYCGANTEKNITEWKDRLPEESKKRFAKYGIDLSQGYPKPPPHVPLFIDEAMAFQGEEVFYDDRAKYADPEKKALFGAAKEVRNLTKHIGTEIVGLQLADLTDQQRDELALLVAERVVVFFRNQDLSPQKQTEFCKYLGSAHEHPEMGVVPDTVDGEKLDGCYTIWLDFYIETSNYPMNFRRAHLPKSSWHIDVAHELQPPGYMHLHNDAIPQVGGDTVWSSGYAAYDKLSPAMQKFVEGKTVVFKSSHSYVDPKNPLGPKKFIEREHPLVRTHPATGWKSLYVNRATAVRIVQLEPSESELILNYLCDVLENNLDIQVRWNWPSDEGYGTSAIWDNRVCIHNAIWDHEGRDPRHGTRVATIAEIPYFDPASKSQREALGMPH